MTGMHLFLFYFGNFVKVYSESQRLNINIIIAQGCLAVLQRSFCSEILPCLDTRDINFVIIQALNGIVCLH